MEGVWSADIHDANPNAHLFIHASTHGDSWVTYTPANPNIHTRFTHTPTGDLHTWVAYAVANYNLCARNTHCNDLSNDNDHHPDRAGDHTKH